MTRSLLLTVSSIVVLAVAGQPAAAAAPPSCDGRRATIVGTPAGDRITGTAGADVIVARGGNDVIDGGGGHDLVCAGKGADRVTGGPGRDHLFGGLDKMRFVEEEGWYITGDVLSGGPGDDRLDAGADSRGRRGVRTRLDTISWQTSPRAVSLDLAAGTAVGEGQDSIAPGRLEVLLTAYDDTVHGSSGRDVIQTFAGGDTVLGRGGPDALALDGRGDTSADRGVGGAGRDFIASSGGNDTLRGGPGHDRLLDPTATHDVLRGGQGNDRLVHRMVYSAGLVMTGGGGRDLLEVVTPRARHDDVAVTTVDLAEGTFDHTPDGQATVSHRVPGFEKTNLGHFDELSLSATNGRNVIFVEADEITVHALGGDDDLYPCCNRGDHLDGGAGHDRLLNSNCRQNTCVGIEEPAGG